VARWREISWQNPYINRTNKSQSLTDFSLLSRAIKDFVSEARPANSIQESGDVCGGNRCRHHHRWLDGGTCEARHGFQLRSTNNALHAAFLLR
jgi:hypothetical protein